MMTRHLHISGLVQGVGYRASFEAQAQALHLSGWVRNRRDGTVEALVAGELAQLDAITEWTRRGPPAARVDTVVATATDDAAVDAGSFKILPTT